MYNMVQIYLSSLYILYKSIQLNENINDIMSRSTINGDISLKKSRAQERDKREKKSLVSLHIQKWIKMQ